MCGGFTIFGKDKYVGNNMGETVVERLWSTLSMIAVALWGFFQSIHYLLITLVFIMAVNLFLRTVLTLKNCHKRRISKKKIDVTKCIRSLGYLGILGEFAVAGFGLCFLSAIYSFLGMDGKESPDWLFWVIRVISYFLFLVYTIMTFERLSMVFPNTTIVVAVKWFIGLIKLEAILPPAISDKFNLNQDTVKELGSIVKEEVEDENKDLAL